jgi:hypothetical protein
MKSFLVECDILHTANSYIYFTSKPEVKQADAYKAHALHLPSNSIVYLDSHFFEDQYADEELSSCTEQHGHENLVNLAFVWQLLLQKPKSIEILALQHESPGKAVNVMTQMQIPSGAVFVSDRWYFVCKINNLQCRPY